MVKRIEVCNTTLETLGTPFHPQGRLLGVGGDCVWLPLYTGKKLGLFKDNIEVDVKGYPQIPDGVMLRQKLIEATEKEVNKEDMKIGDILLMKFMNEPQHVAIYMSDNKFIHAYQIAGKVVMVNLDEKWKNRIVGVFQFHNIED